MQQSAKIKSFLRREGYILYFLNQSLENCTEVFDQLKYICSYVYLSKRARKSNYNKSIFEGRQLNNVPMICDSKIRIYKPI